MFNLALFFVFTVAAFSGQNQIVSSFDRKVDGFFNKSKTDIAKEVSVRDDLWQKEYYSFANKNTGETYLANARSYLAIDLENGQVLERKNENLIVPVASLTKLMTAYLALKDLPLSKEIGVTNFEVRPDDSLMGLTQKDRLSVTSLLKGLLINSGGDAAQVLAVADAGSLPAFVRKMNNKAQELGLENTHFENPVGWDDPKNYSTANDISKLTRILLRNKFFALTVKEKSSSVKTTSGKIINLSNTNLLLSENIIGVKTGYTPAAGECLITLQSRNDHAVLTVILGSQDRFGQTDLLLDWINKHYLW